MKLTHRAKLLSFFSSVCVLLLLALVCCTSTTVDSIAKTSTGLDELIRTKWDGLKGKRVGLIANQTSLTSAGSFGPDLLAQTKDLKLVALYSPEHGLFGKREAGNTSDSSFSYRGVPVFSLYGSARKPSKQMLHGVNALVFDIQDIGVRPYTYLSTMILAMEAAAENNIPFYVLDRPNPLGGERIEGNVLDIKLKSFVGQVPVPYIHGMTLGEIAKMAKGEKWFNKAEKLSLTVIPLKNWTRQTLWNETGLTWTAPSPNIPHAENAVGAAMFGAIGELGVVSIGVNTERAFLRLGSSIVTGASMERIARSVLPASITIQRNTFTAPVANLPKTFDGVELMLPSDWRSVTELYPYQFRLMEELLKDPEFRKVFDAVPQSSRQMFTKVTGTEALLPTIIQCTDLSSLLTTWHQSADLFRTKRKKYLIYK